MESKHPPRCLASAGALHNLRNGRRPLMWPLNLVEGQCPQAGEEIYLSLSEANALAEEREARALAEGKILGLLEWAKEMHGQRIASSNFLYNGMVLNMEDMIKRLEGDLAKAQAPEKEEQC